MLKGEEGNIAAGKKKKKIQILSKLNKKGQKNENLKQTEIATIFFKLVTRLEYMKVFRMLKFFIFFLLFLFQLSFKYFFTFDY